MSNYIARLVPEPSDFYTLADFFPPCQMFIRLFSLSFSLVFFCRDKFEYGSLFNYFTKIIMESSSILKLVFFNSSITLHLFLLFSIPLMNTKYHLLNLYSPFFILLSSFSSFLSNFLFISTFWKNVPSLI